MTDFSLILPVHNEETIIETVVKEVIASLKKIKFTYEVILVENGSTDKSLAVIKKIASGNKNIKILVAKKGYGSAIIKGLKIARGKYVCYMVSDGQVDLALIHKLWKEILIGEYDLVKVKRANRESRVRSLTSWFFNKTISLVFKTPLVDVNGSPRIFLREHVGKLNLQSKDSFIDAEFLVKISKLKWKIKEFPMKNIQRYGGESTRSYKTYFEFFRNIFMYKFFSK